MRAEVRATAGSRPEMPEAAAAPAARPQAPFARQAVSYFFAIALPAFVNVAYIMLFTRMFSAEEFGHYSLAYTASTIAIILATSWMTQSVQRFRPLYREAGRLPAFNRNLALTLACVNGAVAAVAGALYGIAGAGLGEYEPYFWPTVVLVLIQNAFLLTSVVYQSDMKVAAFRRYQIWNAVLRLAVSLALVLLFRHAVHLLWGSAVSMLLLLMIMHRGRIGRLFAPNRERERMERFRDFTRKFAGYGFPLVGWYFASTTIGLFDRFLLESFWGSGQVGIYSANYTIVYSGLGLVCTPLLTAAQPMLMRMPGDTPEQWKAIEDKIRHFSRLYIGCCVPFAFFVLAYYKQINAIFLGPEFRQGAVVVPILLAGFLIWNFGLYGQKGYEIRYKSNVMLLFIGIAVAACIGFNLLLIPKYGYLGAAVSNVLAYTVYPLLIYTFSRNYIRWSIPWLSVLRAAIASVAAYGAALALDRLLPSAIGPLGDIAAGLPAMAAVYALLMISLKEWDRKEIAHVLRAAVGKIGLNKTARNI